MKYDTMLTVCREALDLHARKKWCEEEIERQKKYILILEKENRKLKYEYNDSLLQRDVPLPVKWKTETYGETKCTVSFCPKCGHIVNNWQSYCEMCGQKLKHGNYEPEMEIKDDGKNDS